MDKEAVKRVKGKGETQKRPEFPLLDCILRIKKVKFLNGLRENLA